MKNKNFYKNGIKHLEIDPIMKFLIFNFKDKIDLYNRYNKNYAKAIANLIIEQQISFKAAITIKKKFNILTKDLNNDEIIRLNNSHLQKIGISSVKVEYIKNVYIFFKSNKINFSILSDRKIKDILTSIKGVGSWTAEMFLIFILFREDIFSIKDLALINSIKINYNIKSLSSKKVNQLISSWKPYNTLASLLLWKSIEKKVFYKK